MIGERIRACRTSRGLTLKELGEVLKVAESTVSLYETGKRSPDYETLKKMAEFFKVSTDYLLGLEEKSTKKDTPGGVSDEDILFALFDGDIEREEISDEMFQEVKDYAKFVRDRKRKQKDGFQRTL